MIPLTNLLRGCKMNRRQSIADLRLHFCRAALPCRRVVWLLTVILLSATAACAPVANRPDVQLPSDRPSSSAPDLASYPRSASEVSGAAVLSLLQQAHADTQAGRGEHAVAKLENALRIESRNAFVWQQLAQTHLQQQRLDQAETVAQRSNSLARGNPWIEIENWRVIAAVRHARGDKAGALAAEDKVTELQVRLDD